MEIDWITVSAQIVNFLILVGLLRHFLYRPVLEAMDRREARIAGRLEEADARERSAEEKAAEFEAARAKLEGEREGLLAEADRDADAERKRRLEAVRGEVAESRAAWHAQVEREKAAFLEGLRRGAADVVQAAVHRALADLADEDLESRIVARFARRTQSLDPEGRAALSEGSGPAHVTTSFPLDDAAQDRIESAVRSVIGEGPEVVFETSEALLCGVSLARGGRRLSWSLESYLEALSTELAAAFAPSSEEG